MLVNGKYSVSGPRGYRKFVVRRQKATSTFFGGKVLLAVEDAGERYGWRSFAEVTEAGVRVFRTRERENSAYANLLVALTQGGGTVEVKGVTYTMVVTRTCAVCNSPLVHPESVARGIGPECSGAGYKNPKGKAKQTAAAAA